MSNANIIICAQYTNTLAKITLFLKTTHVIKQINTQHIPVNFQVVLQVQILHCSTVVVVFSQFHLQPIFL